MEETKLKQIAEALSSDALAFGTMFIQDSGLRAEYIKKVKAASEAYVSNVRSGAMTAGRAAEEMHALRNQIMDFTRSRTTSLGLSYAEKLKAAGRTFEYMLEKKAKELFGRSFTSLAASEMDTVYISVIESAGRANPGVSANITKLSRLGRGFWLLTAGIAISNVAVAEDKGAEVAHQGVIIGGGFLGSVAGGAAAGLVCGPGAPVCVTIGAFLGGVLAAFGGELALDYARSAPRSTAWSAYEGRKHPGEM